MNIYEIIILLLILTGLCLSAHKHGKPEEGVHSFWVHLLCVIINLFLFIKAGLFIH